MNYFGKNSAQFFSATYQSMLRFGLIATLFFGLIHTSFAKSTTWTGAAGTNAWSTASNWSNGVPAKNDDVVIVGVYSGSPISVFPVYSSGTLSLTSITLQDWNGGSGSLTVSGGSLTATTVTLNGSGAKSLIINGGSLTADNIVNTAWNGVFTIAVNSGTLTVQKQLRLVGNANSAILTGTGGNIVLNGVNNTNILDLSTNSKIDLNGTGLTVNKAAELNGQVTFGSGTIVFNNNVSIHSNGVVHVEQANFTATGQTTVLGALYADAGTLTFGSGAGNGNAQSLMVNGTFHGGTATMSVLCNLNVNSGGNLMAENATINLENNVDVSGGSTITVENGSITFGDNVTAHSSGTIDVVGSGAIIINANAELYSSGFINVGDGELSISGDLSLSNGASITAESATVNISGSLDLTNSGTSFSAGSSTINFSGTTWNNSGTFDAGTSTVNLSSTGSQTISGADITFYNLNVVSGDVNSDVSIVVLNDAQVEDNTTLDVATGESIEIQGQLETNNPTVISSTRPFILFATAIAQNKVRIQFNEEVTVATAQNLANWNITPGLTIDSIVRYSATDVRLALSGNLISSTEYTITVNNVVNLSGTAVNTNHTKRFVPIILPSEPSQKPQILSLNVLSPKSVRLSWNPGNGEGTLVLIKKGGQNFPNPNDGTPYNANAVFGLGQAISNGAFAAFRGNDTSIIINNLPMNRTLSVAIYNYNGSGNNINYYTSDFAVTTFHTNLALDLKVMLEGPYDSIAQEMTTELNQLDLLPLSQPYNIEPFNYSGSENVNDIPSADIVDWVLVELRKASQPGLATESSRVAMRACFLLKDGSVVDLDGSSTPVFEIAETGNMYAVVYHRNHLPVVTGDSIAIGNNENYEYSISDGVNKNYNGTPTIVLSNGIYGLIQARIDQSVSPFTIDLNDKSRAWDMRMQSGYLIEDTNLDGIVNAVDRAAVFNNLEESAEMP